MRFLRLLIFIPVLAFSSFANPDGVMSARQQNWQHLISQTLSPKDKVVILGDTDHDSVSLLQVFSHLMKSFKDHDPSFDCLLVEDEPQMNSSFAAYISGRKSFEHSVVQEMKRRNVQMNRNHRDFSQTDLAYQMIYDAAKIHGYKVFGYDINFRTELGRQVVNAYEAVEANDQDLNVRKNFAKLVIERRNQIMAEHVQKLMATQCRKSLVLIGTAHLYFESYDQSVQSFPEYLSQRGLKSASYFVKSLNCVHEASSSPSACDFFNLPDTLGGFAERHSTTKPAIGTFYGP